MKILIIDNGTKYLKKLEILTRDHQVKTLHWHDQSLKGLTDYNLVILSGSHDKALLENEDYFENEIDFVKTTKIPILGICFGFEVIADAFGSTISLMSEKEKGILSIKIIKNDPILSRMRLIRAWENHRWVVTRINRPLVGLAKSRLGYEIIKHESKLIYGFQFHPEMLTIKTKGAQIFSNLVDQIEAFQ